MMRNFFSQPAAKPLIYAICVIIGLLGGKFLYDRGGDSSFSNSGKGKIQDILKKVDEYYVDDVDVKELQEKTISHLLEQLDPHSVYISSEEMQFETEQLEGNFDGIGVEFRIIQDTICILYPIPGGPSAKAGIVPGDKIIKVQNKLFIGNKITVETAMKTLRGPKGSEVNITLLRNKQVLQKTIIRGEIPLNSVDIVTEITPGVGYIKIESFSKKTAQEFRTAAEKLQQKGIKSLIVDVRGNPGGIMDAVIEVVNELMVKGKLIVYTKSRQESDKFFTTKDGLFNNLPLAVLIDENSASASEILAGAIQDNDRGWVIGRRSFGKGLVQRPFMLKDGSSLRLTIARYYTPVGRCIQRDYANGKEDYYLQSDKRLSSGELTSADSIPVVDSLKFKTPKGKIVYGGGGIMPDIFVPVDTGKYSFYYWQIMEEEILDAFFIQNFYKYRPLLRGKNLKEDVQLLEKSAVFSDFILYLKKQKKVPFKVDEFKKSEQTLKQILLGRFLKSKYGNIGQYYLTLYSDKVIEAALKTIFSSSISK